jgi:hypothetical protein
MPTKAEHLRIANEEMRAQLDDLEVQVHEIASAQEHMPIDPEEERGDNDPLADDSLNNADSLSILSMILSRMLLKHSFAASRP